MNVSFECVIRLAAGIDNIAQAAGRCNRSGEYGATKQVYVVKLKDEKLGSLGDIKRACEAYANSIAKIDSFDPADTELISKYYREYFSLATDHRNETLYPANTGGIPVRLYDLLSVNKKGRETEKYSSFGNRPCLLNQAFETAGSLYHAIDDDAYAVIVPYDDCARKIIIDLCSKRATDAIFVSGRLKDANPYVVSVGKTKLNTLIERKAVKQFELFDKNVYILGEGEYDSNTGLLDENTIL